MKNAEEEEEKSKKKSVTLKAVLFMVRVQRMVGDTSRKLSFKRNKKLRSKSQHIRRRRLRGKEDCKSAFDFDVTSSFGSSIEEPSHGSGDSPLYYEEISPGFHPRSGSNSSRYSRFSGFSKRSAPSTYSAYNHHDSCDSVASTPGPLSPCPSPAHETAAPPTSPEIIKTVQFTEMNKPYTLTMLPGQDNGLIRSKPGIMVNYNKGIGAKSLIQRHDSMKEMTTSTYAGKRTKIRPLKRQCTDVNEAGEMIVKNDDERNKSSDGGAVRKTSAYQQTQRYVRRQKSGDQLTGTSAQNDQESLEQRRPTIQLSKADRKKIEKFKKNMKELLELFTAVEQDDIGTVRIMLQKGQVDVNGENLDDVTPLDVALMLNHTDVALLLLKHGAQENPKLSSVNARLKKLQTLTDNAQTKLAELRLSANNIQKAASQSKDYEKQLSWYESRLHMLKKMRINVENATTPLPPRNVVLEVGSSTSLLVSLEPPEQNQSIVTRYLVEWSQTPEFEVEGSLLMKDLRRLELTIPNLRSGQTYYVRVTSGNYKGSGEATICQPACAVPSSWREVNRKTNRSQGQHEAITSLFHEINQMRKDDLWERVFPNPDKGMKKKKSSLRNLFSASNRFQKTIKKGIYLATILYKEDKVVCTVDDNLPVILIDENEPASLTVDFNWFMKISCSWDDSRWLNCDSTEITNSSPSLQFRSKLLDAAYQMQVALGVQDLGRLHSRPFIDSQSGTTVLVTVQRVSDVKAVQGLAIKWLPIAKLLKNSQSGPPTSLPVIDLLAGSVLDHLNFNESSYIPLDRGLYLCYMKLHASMNDISLVVPENLPSVLPFVYIRQNPQVSKDEWEWLHILDSNQVTCVRPTSSQIAFHWSLVSGARMLLDDLQVSSDDILSHRLYLSEVIQVHSDVSFILVVPSASDVCSAPSLQTQASTSDRRGCLSLPVPIFEMAHLCTYQPDFISLYCRLSTFLDYYQLLLQQMLRRALNDSESQRLKEQLNILGSYQTKVDDIWKSIRWITNVASHARDKQHNCGLPFSVLFAYSLNDFSMVEGHCENVIDGRHSDGSDDGAENSEGYHSDQSIDKSNSGSKLNHPLQPPVLPVLSMRPSLENPTYDFPERLQRPSVRSDFHTPQSRTPAVYINVPPSPTATLSSVNNSHFQRPPSPTPLPHRRPLLSTSYLQVRDARKRLMQPSLERSNSDPIARSPTKEKPVSPLVRGCVKHEYVNCATTSQQQSSDSEQSCCSNRSINLPNTAVSDTELISRRRKMTPAQPIEDLSVIDQLYATASLRSQTPSMSIPVSRPGTASPHFSLASTSRANSRGSTESSPLQAGIIRVYAAYPCGLSKGTSVKLQITPKTVAKEVVTLVVQQLNKAVQQKGLNCPIYGEEEMNKFCLVAVIGARERCLREDFAPLELQNPWAKGRLFVRQKDNVLAALEFGNEAKV